MKRYLISIVAIIVVLAIVLVAFGQQARTRGRFNREAQQNAITAIETQLAKLKLLSTIINIILIQLQ